MIAQPASATTRAQQRRGRAPSRSRGSSRACRASRRCGRARGRRSSAPLPPQAATIGASSSETLSPTPPVECLSSTGPVVPLEHGAGVASSRRVSATRSSSSRSRKKTAIANAATWPSDSPPSAIPRDEERDLLVGQRARRRACAGSAPAGSRRGPRRSARSAGRAAPRPPWPTRSVCSWLSSSPPIPSARFVTARHGGDAQARRGGRRSPRAPCSCRRGRRRACGTRGSRPASRSSGRRRRGRRRRAARCRARRRRRAGARAARGRRRRARLGKRGPTASSFGPVSGLKPSRLMWSDEATRLPGPASGRSEPAAFVSTSISAPSALSVRIGVVIAPPSIPS